MRYTVLLLLLSFRLSAQTFQPDVFGHVNGQEFRDYIQKEGFELVGAFARETYRGDTIWISKVMKGGEWFYIDNSGNRFADEQAFKDFLDRKRTQTTMTERFQRTGPRDREVMHTVEELVIYEDISMNSDETHDNKVFTKGKRYGYRSNGKELLPPDYDAIEIAGSGYEALLKLTRKGKQGLADLNGKIIVPVEHEEVYVLFEESDYQLVPKGIVTRSKEGYSLLTLEGIVRTTPQPYQPSPSNGFILLTDPVTGKKGAMTESGQRLIPVAYDAVYRNEETDLVFVSNGREYDDDYKQGAYDLQGNPVIEAKYQHIGKFEGTILSVRLDEGPEWQYGLFDTQSKTFILPVEYRWEDYGINPRLIVHKGPDEARIYGMINRKGEWILPPQYSYMSYKENSAFIVAAMEGKYGVLDTTSLTVIPFTYDYLRALNNCTRCGNLPKDQFIAGMNENYGIIDKANKIVLPLTLPRFASTNTALGIEGFERSVFMDLKGNILYTAEFHVTRFYGGLIEGRTNDNRKVTADLYGNTVFN